MRESRTYGSVRGACDETHVPTATGVDGPLAASSVPKCRLVEVVFLFDGAEHSFSQSGEKTLSIFSICEVVDEAVPVKAPGIYIFPLARRSERFPEIRVVQVL